MRHLALLPDSVKRGRYSGNYKELVSDMHVFIMRENWHGGMAAIQSLGRRGHRLTVGVERSASIHTRSDYVTDVIATPRDPDLAVRARVLCELVEARGFDLVVPQSDEDAEVVALAAGLRPGCRAFVTPDVEAIRRTRDRNATWDLCRELGIGVPHAVRVTAETVRTAAKEMGYPCYLKFSDSVANVGVVLLNGPEDLTAQLAAIAEAGEAQVQEVFEGEFVGATGFAIDGRLIESFAFEMRDHLSNAGTPAFAWRLEAPEVTRILGDLVRHLNWTGGVDLDCLRGANGDLRVLEVNPRMSGTSHFALVCGVDLPAGYLRALGEPVDAPVFEPQTPDLFISLLEEARYRHKRGGAAEARKLRRENLYATNAYPGDRGYGRALRRRRARLRLEEWGLGLLRAVAKLVRR